MNFYNQQHKYYCGIDLHAKSLYVCILDNKGKKVVHRKIRNDGEYLMKLLAPYREDVVVGVECMFAWYWVADLCIQNNIPFVLGFALYMKAIHGGKAKNDKIDSRKIAVLLRGGMFPQAYVYPREMRATRDLMRRRIHFVRKKAELLAHIQMTRIQYNLPEFEKRIRYRQNRVTVLDAFTEPAVKSSIEADVRTILHYEEMLKGLDLEIKRSAKVHDPNAFRLLQTIRGIGDILALTILYEIHTIERFPTVQDFCSYARLVKCSKESAGKLYGTSGAKIGNANLKWAFSEAAISFIRHNEEGKVYLEKIEKRHGKPKALSILAAKLGRAVYFMLKKQRSFDIGKFINR